ncbi:hypothetical protein OAG51_02995 [Pirellulaceae bacterium]|nr:hypothetical protein [Pirellulaceae bacterium]
MTFCEQNVMETVYSHTCHGPVQFRSRRQPVTQKSTNWHTAAQHRISVWKSATHP